MPGQLSQSESTWHSPVESPRCTRWVLIHMLAIVGSLVVAGALAGVVWQQIWTPPAGVAFQGRWVLDGEGLPADFAGTGLFALVGVVTGLLVGALVALLFDEDEVYSLAVVVLGAVLAVGVMWWVGTTLGPPDPSVLAKTADDFDPIVSDLRVHGFPAFAALPFGAILATAAVHLLRTPRPSR
ncbi:membrane hypothetical protein [metagenome]|uniref:Uncharacterized protein n=1 Tax=metagenome TaxID=256318 RepID=A0A2P2BWB9_9ZZZZ